MKRQKNTAARKLLSWEAALQVVRRDAVEFEELFARPLPHGRVLRFVPDFPVSDVPAEAVRPALVVVADDMLADARPLREVLGRVDAVGLDLLEVLNGDSQTVEDLRAGFDDRLQVGVGEGEVV